MSGERVSWNIPRFLFDFCAEYDRFVLFKHTTKGANGMITWRNWMEKYLTDRGIWPEEAVAIVTNAVAKNDSLGEIVDRAHEGYPPVMDASAALCLNSEAVSWIDDNKPMHFARPMFTGELT